MKQLSLFIICEYSYYRAKVETLFAAISSSNKYTADSRNISRQPRFNVTTAAKPPVLIHARWCGSFCQFAKIKVVQFNECRSGFEDLGGLD